MIIGSLSLSLRLDGAPTIKEKRRVVNSLKDQLRNRFNVAVAEVDAQDNRRVAALGVVTVGTDKRHVNSQLSAIADWVERTRLAELEDYELELW